MSQIQHELPSTQRLLKATAIAAAVAGVILITAVLPAEYGVDPTGIGTRLGLTALSTSTDDASAAPSTPSTGTAAPVATMPSAPASQAATPRDAQLLVKQTADFRRDTQSITLEPGDGTELKARMKAGDTFVFHWVASAAVSVDMHGERAGAKEGEFTSYWLESEQSTASGSFTAPFDGSHGWYWENGGTSPVTIRLDLSGFHEDLFSP